MKKIFTLLFVGMLVALVTSCGQEEKKIGFSASTLSNPFFKDIEAGIESGLIDSGYTLVTLGAEDDAAKQGSQIEDLIAQQVAVLIINPVNSTTLGTKIDEANEAGIPVITVDRGSDSGTVVAHIASDNKAGGLMAGKFLKEQNSENLPVLELIGVAGNSATTSRSEGFREGIEGSPDFAITANFNRAEGQTTTENYINTLPESVTGIAVFAANDEMALGAVRAIKDSSKIDLSQSIIIGFDAIGEAVESVQAGDMLATVAQQPIKMGELAAEVALNIIDGGEIQERDIPVDLELITK